MGVGIAFCSVFMHLKKKIVVFVLFVFVVCFNPAQRSPNTESAPGFTADLDRFVVCTVLSI